MPKYKDIKKEIEKDIVNISLSYSIDIIDASDDGSVCRRY